MSAQADALERLRRVQEILETLKERDAEFSERLIRHEYESAEARSALAARITEMSQKAETPAAVPEPPRGLWSEVVSTRHGQLLVFSIAVALLAWSGVPIKRWVSSVSIPAVQGDGADDSEAEHGKP